MKKPIPFIALLCALFLAVSACNNRQEQNTDATTVTGIIKVPASGMIYFYSYADSVDLFLARQTPLDSAQVDENGNFAFQIKGNSPHVFNLRYNNRDLVSNLLICPGDKIDFQFHGKEQIPQITPFGAAAKFNTYLLQFPETFYKDSVKGKQYYIASNYMDPVQFETYNERRKKEMMDFYTGFFKGDSLRTEYQSFAVNTICYELASDRLMYLWKKRMKGEPVTPDSSFFAFATPSFVEKEDAFITPSYIRFLNLYIRDVYDRMVESGELPENKAENPVPAAEKYKLAMKLLNGRVRDAVLYNLILNDQHDVSGAEISSDTPTHNLDSLLATFKSKYRLD